MARSVPRHRTISLAGPRPTLKAVWRYCAVCDLFRRRLPHVITDLICEYYTGNQHTQKESVRKLVDLAYSDYLASYRSVMSWKTWRMKAGYPPSCLPQLPVRFRLNAEEHRIRMHLQCCTVSELAHCREVLQNEHRAHRGLQFGCADDTPNRPRTLVTCTHL